MSINNKSYQNITEAAYNVMSGKKSLNEGFAGYDYDPPFSGSVGNPPSFSFVQPLNFISLYVMLQNRYDSPYDMAENEPGYAGSPNPFEPDDGWDRFFVLEQFGTQNYDYNGDGIVDFSDFLILFNMAFNPAIPNYINAPFYQKMLEKGAESRIPTVRPPKNPLADRPGTRPTDPTPPIGGVREEIMGGSSKLATAAYPNLYPSTRRPILKGDDKKRPAVLGTAKGLRPSLAPKTNPYSPTIRPTEEEQYVGGSKYDKGGLSIFPMPKVDMTRRPINRGKYIPAQLGTSQGLRPSMGYNTPKEMGGRPLNFRRTEEEMPQMGADKKRNPLFGGSESDMIRQIAAKAMSGGEIPKVPSAGGMPQMGGMKPPAGGMPQMDGMPKMGGMEPPVAPQGMEQGMGMKPQMSGMGAMGGMKPPAPAPEMPSMSDQPDIKKKLQNIVPFDPEKKKKKGMMGIEGEAMQAYQGARAGRQMFKTQARRGY